MSSNPNEPAVSRHPVVEFGARGRARATELAGSPVWSMTPAEQRRALVDLTLLESQIAALKLQVLAEADRRGATDAPGEGTGAQDAAAWVAVETRHTGRSTRADLRLAKRLDERYPHLAAALAQGAANIEQARVIVTALDRVPTTGDYAVSAQQVTRAEEHLVACASVHDARALSVLGRRLYEIIAPEIAEEYEGRALEAQEARALRKVSLTTYVDSEGICHGRFRTTALHGQILLKLLQAFTNPARSTECVACGEASGIDPELPTEVRNGLAFCDLLEAIPADWAPQTGGCGATIVVTMTLDHLAARLTEAGVCDLDTGGVVSAAQARRLACTAGIIPMVLGGASMPLDVGRQRRFHTRYQRLALAQRDQGCSTVDCDKPASMSVAHHDIPWAQGGGTNVDGGRLLCPHHHRRIHDPSYGTTRHPGGKVSFHRRT